LGFTNIFSYATVCKLLNYLAREAIMSKTQNGPTFGGLIVFSLALLLGSYFTYSAVQGDYGVFRKVKIEAELKFLHQDHDVLKAELAEIENLTTRLSDDYLDLDLLDERARDVLGYVRHDEIVIR
jgi:cell division protein FtsB